MTNTTKTTEKKKMTNYSAVINYVWYSYKQFPKNGLIALFSRIISTALMVVPPMFYKQIFDILSQSGIGTSELVSHAISVLLIVLWIQLGSWITHRIYDYFSITFEMDIQEWLNNTFLKQLQGHSFQFFTNNFTGSLISKVRKGVSAFERITDILAREILPFIINVVFILVIVGFESWPIALAMLVVIVVFSILQYKLYLYIYPYQEKANALDSEQGGLLSDIITNNHTIKLFGSEQEEEKSYAKLNLKTVKARKLQYFKSMRIWWSTGLLSVILQIGILYIAIRMRVNGIISLGMIVLLQTYTFMVMDFLRGMGHTFRNIFKATSEAWEIIELIQTPHEINDTSDKKIRINRWEIKFEKVCFSYDANQIFYGLDLHIKSGERVALVGESGSGKTTITKLLFRFYDIAKGEILIDDQNIAEVTQNSLRSAMAMIPQDPILFHRSIKENIAYGQPHASEEEIIAAAKMARCHDFVSKLKDGYDTLVGERGIKLSGGERQRVAIARAILENKQIIVMDEATSALDSESEFLIQEAMQDLMQNKTVLIIAHRLSTIMKMDKIIVMDKGKVVEKGSHKELLAKDWGMYKKLREIQSWGFIG